MNWIKKRTREYEVFWHLTSKDKANVIIKTGLKQFDDQGINAYGLGVYCILRDSCDTTQLNTLIQLLERRDIPQKDQVIIEFEYMGEYLINDAGSSIYEEDGWILIQKDIPVEHIDKVIPIKEV